ncbi:transient receptor potential cation channel subfamily A member 1-like [Penaeus indicus]|uniref:transient receptor potential cation channel subfamily A member 1-like n=1 Tax=Penaeus indicus TaxID=29960 RepID=UPI00300CA7D1
MPDQKIKDNNNLKYNTRQVTYVSIPMMDTKSSRKVADEVTLRDAVVRKDFHLCAKLLEEGADVNTTDEDGSTLLHILARKYSKVETRAKKIPALLLQHGANVNAKDKNGDTPLHVVAREGSEDFCRVILDHIARNPGVKVDTKNKKLMAPLHLASQQGHDRIVQLLLDVGSDPLSSDGQKYFPIHHAAEKGYATCCKLLFPSYPGDAKTESKVMTPLMLAARGGFYRCLEVMTGEKIDLNKQDQQGNTALHIAAKAGFDKFVKQIIALESDINIKNKAGNTPLMEAVTKNRASCLLMLLHKGAKVDEVNKMKRSILHIASDKRSGECMEYILKSGDMKKVINLQDNDGCTALHIAIKRDYEKCALLLLDAGASPEVACKQKFTPLHLATQCTKTNLLENLLKHKGLDLDPENLNKETPFHLAAKSGLRDTCLLLLRKGARLNAVNKHGQTALHLSAYHGHHSVVKLLIKRGIDKRATDDKGSVALHAAALKGNLECCKVLVEADRVSSKEKNKGDKYPLDYAYINGHQKVFQFLLQSLPFKSIATLPQGIHERLHSHTHKALKESNKSAVETIVESMWWEAGFGSGKKHDREPCKNFRDLIKLYPSLAERVMDKCTTTCPTTRVKSYDFRIFEDNYYIGQEKRSCLDIPQSPFYQDTWRVTCFAEEIVTDNLLWKKEHPVNLMVVHRCPQLLQHPLTNAWLSHKWTSYIRFIYFGTLFLQLIFMTTLVAFMVVVQNWQQVTQTYNMTKDEFCKAMQGPHPVNSTSLVQEANATSPRPPDAAEENPLSWDPWPSYICHVALCLSLAGQIALEVNYFFKLRCLYLNVTSLVSLSCMALCIVLLLPTSVCSLQLGIKSVFSWQCGIIALVLASIRFISTINRLPAFSMFTSINHSFIMSYLKGVMYVLVILFLFALIFHLLLSNQLPFATLPQALVKIVVWMLGDLAYDETFIKPLHYPYLVNCLFLVFLFTVGVLIVTLLKAPSSDINKIKFYRLARQAQMYFMIDISFPRFKRSYAVGKFSDKEHKPWIVSKLEKILNRRQPGAVVVQNLLNVVKIGLIDDREYRKPVERHWLVVKVEEILNTFTSEDDDSQDFPNVTQEKIVNQCDKLDQLLVLYNQLYESYQKQNEQISELKNQIDNLKLHTF